MTGTSFSQAIPILISPLLTRLYSPAEFGTFSVYMAIVSFLAIVSALRYDHGIVLARDKGEANRMLALCLSINTLVAVAIFFVVLILRYSQIDVDIVTRWQWWFYLLPVSVLFLGIISALNNRMIWERRYGDSAKNKVLMSSSNAALSISLGYFGITSIGLVLSNFISSVGSFIFLSRRARLGKIIRRTGSFSELFLVAKKNRDFPINNLPAAIVNGFYNNGRFIFIGLFFSSIFVGYLALVIRVLQVPVTVISSAISDVVFKEAAECYQKRNYNRLRKDIVRLLLVLALVGTVPLLIIWFFSVDLFELVFGPSWRIAGEYASIMSLGLYFVLLGSPFCKVFWGMKKNRIYLVWEVIRVIAVYVPLLVLALLNAPEDHVVWALSLSLVFSYAVLIAMIFAILKIEIGLSEKSRT